MIDKINMRESITLQFLPSRDFLFLWLKRKTTKSQDPEKNGLLRVDLRGV